jgi:GH25 family lysozyme M1 (1,4-beta-N-acetylmuramidase)
VLPRLKARLGAVTCAVALAVTAGPAAAADYPTGPDVSRYQHPAGTSIDWAAVRAGGHSFAFVKATEGRELTNPYFAQDWAAVRAAGLYRGAYHYAWPDADADDAVTEAENFVATVGVTNRPGDLPPVLDLEQDGGLDPTALAAWAQTFLTTVQAATGRTPILYTYPTFWAGSMGSSDDFTAYPLWIAHYGATTPTITPWSRWTFWQHSSTGTVSGISTVGGTDVNRFNGTAAELARLALVPALPALSLAVPPAAVRYGGSATVTGKLRRADGTGVPATEVKLYGRRTGETSPRLLAAVRTATDGSYRYTWKPLSALELTARSAATPVDLAAASPAARLRVSAALDASWSDRTVTRGTLVHLRGTVRPHPAGTVVTRQVWDGARWKAVAKVTAGPDGRFSFPVRARASTPRAHRVVATPAGYATGSGVLPKLRIS